MKREESIRLLKAASLMLLGKDNQPVSDLYYALLDAVDALEKPDVLYFCDGNKCDMTDCLNSDCCRTTDLSHAKFFMPELDDNGNVICYVETFLEAESEVQHDSL